MFRFILSRLLQGLAVIIGVLCITFGLLRLAPGGPFQGERDVPEHIRKQQMVMYGMDQPVLTQLWNHIVSFATFNFPPSPKSPGRGVDEIIIQAFPVSAQVGLLALAIALAIGIPIGALAALRPNTLEDRASTVVATLGICTPSMVLGPLLALVFGLKLRWFNASGWYDADDWVLPAATLGFIYSASIARLTRGGLRETLAQEFIRTARAKGASELAIVFRRLFTRCSSSVSICWWTSCRLCSTPVLDSSHERCVLPVAMAQGLAAPRAQSGHGGGDDFINPARAAVLCGAIVFILWSE
jgi:oligopeptide transport system permease protein